ncbi:hypothetical protein Tdes44962_MAKER07009 [Teratosphaeria destructans]|uniref:Uncharacterized protein n=1 Tax=Teratosphaeria destructans TaxID=418781 RepID=A0A9W7T0P2_9PEZI|nr:hypothetical protein Tdes44962_MAKER07009 [Teratosphaeria destructans]
MAPDLNSLPASNPSTPNSPSHHQQQQRPRRISFNNNNNNNAADPARPAPPSPRSPSLSSLQAAAAINAGLQRSPSNASPIRNNHHALERRRSSLMNNLTMNDPTIPAPGELQTSSSNGSPRQGRRSFALPNTADPHHHRQPSLGELHQELENEQEAQVNRLLHMIRIQQDQIAAMHRQQNGHGNGHEQALASPDQTQSPAPSSSLATPASTATADPSRSPRSTSVTGLAHSHLNRPHSLSRQSSTARTNSRGTSPALRPVSGAGSLGPLSEDFLLGGTWDESAFYQAETQTLTRENQMLKLRIRELERQIADLAGPGSQHGGNASGGALAHSPAQNSPLAATPVTFASEAAPAVTAAAEPVAKVE